jgi:hypothetical protein
MKLLPTSSILSILAETPAEHSSIFGHSAAMELSAADAVDLHPPQCTAMIDELLRCGPHQEVADLIFFGTS